MTESVPPWFSDAITAACTEHTVTVDGAAIHYLDWGDQSNPGIVFVHGGGAHAHWWSFLAPLLKNRYRVVALDLSGHGDSDRRERYPRRQWAREVMAVIEHADFTEPPVLVGHSMGGLVSIVAAALHSDALAGVIIVDSPVSKPDPESQARQSGFSFGELKVYPDRETALSRFRLIPSQPCANAYLVDHVARHSLKQVPGGYTWKFDPKIFDLVQHEPMAEHLSSIRCRIALMRGEHSVVVPAETGEYMYQLLHRNAPLVEIPGAHHHLILDQPLAFIAALRALLADWTHSVRPTE
ncbi:MAG: alpha/beta hydrolase [Pseudomonadales bacterium]|nr:alpha/beta hydrolase [Pseudomonadales bacterium]